MGEKVNHDKQALRRHGRLHGQADRQARRQARRTAASARTRCILFLGDNGTGGRHRRSMGDAYRRGGKGRPPTPGMHVPLIANWPGAHPAGQVTTTWSTAPTSCPRSAQPPAWHSIRPEDRRPQLLPQLKGERASRANGSTAGTRAMAARRSRVRRHQHYKLYRSGDFYDLPKTRLKKGRRNKLLISTETKRKPPNI